MLIIGGVGRGRAEEVQRRVVGGIKRKMGRVGMRGLWLWWVDCLRLGSGEEEALSIGLWSISCCDLTDEPRRCELI